MRIDAHHHLWRYDPVEYDWIDGSMTSLQGDFLGTDLEHEAAAAGVAATVAVQARQSLEETNWLLRIAAESKPIRGVVGWAPIASPSFASDMEVLRSQPLLKGLRHVVQGESAGFLDSDSFNAGMDILEPTGLVYDLLIFAHQLEETIRFVDRHPRQQFVLDHIAKPGIARGDFAPWSKALGELAKRGNVACKLSGMVTEADWQRWSPDDLTPYFDRVLEVFRPQRLMVGSDWPVLTVACGYARWWEIVEHWIAPLSASERSQIEGEVAARLYKLDLSQDVSKETR